MIIGKLHLELLAKIESRFCPSEIINQGMSLVKDTHLPIINDFMKFKLQSIILSDFLKDVFLLWLWRKMIFHRCSTHISPRICWRWRRHYAKSSYGVRINSSILYRIENSSGEHDLKNDYRIPYVEKGSKSLEGMKEYIN